MNMPLEYVVERVPHDEAGVAFFVSRYKPFRLTALQTDPSFFGSNYAREAPMPDTFWRDRLLNPAVETFVAVRPDTRDVLSSVTLVGATPISSALKALLGIDDALESGPSLVHWAVNAVYTAREARRQGIGGGVMAEALRYAADEAALDRRSYLVTLLVAEGNSGALSMYAKAGFTTVDGPSKDGYLQLFLWKPYKEKSISV